MYRQTPKLRNMMGRQRFLFLPSTAHSVMCGLACVMFLCFVSCKPGRPSGILSESDMEEILYDYHLAQGAAESVEGDAAAQRYLYVQSVFSKHGISEEEFDSSMVWYSSHPEILYKMYIRLGDRFDAESRSLGLGVSETELYANMSDVGDTANIWSGGKMLVLEANRTNNLRILSITSDSTFLPGDDYKLSLSSTLLGECHEAYVMLNVTYKDKQTSSAVMRLVSSPRVIVELPKRTDCEDYETDRITLTFYVPIKEKRNLSGYLCVHNPALLRMHRVKAQSVEVKDSLAIDTLSRDSFATDSLESDSARMLLQPDEPQRLSPEEMRNQKVVKKQINITDERPLVRRRPRQSVRRAVPVR